jgi:Type ISP C-terminal specificity domain/N-6 DNA Methylase
VPRVPGRRFAAGSQSASAFGRGTWQARGSACSGIGLTCPLRMAMDIRSSRMSNDCVWQRLHAVVHMAGDMPKDMFVDVVSEFGASVRRKLRAAIGQPEAQLRDPFARLLTCAGARLGLDVLTVDETPLDTLGVRPDFLVNVAGAQVGFAELKAPGRKLPGTWRAPNRHERTQWARLQLLPNVLYSDGEQWALFHFGEMAGTVAEMNGDLRTAGARLSAVDGAFARVIQDFLLWKPVPPRSITALVKAVAKLCALLRDEVEQTLNREHTGAEPEPVFTALAEDWRAYLFPGLPDKEFADAYAQTVTFSLLLARIDGIAFEGATVVEIARQLGKRHALMGKALHVLTEGVERRSIVLGTLQRVISAVDWDLLSSGNRDASLRLYGHFLEQYDPERRQQSGSYYTPDAVVSCMVRFADQILKDTDRMGIPWGLASESVTILDPAMGTGSYLLAVIDRVAHTVSVEQGAEAVAPQVRELFSRMIGFEKQACPYAVAQLRISQALMAEHQAEVPDKKTRLLLADTLDSPDADLVHIPATLEPLARSRRNADEVKREIPVDVVIGNPPYRERAKGLGGWIENGNPGDRHPPPLSDFRAAGLGKFERVLSNLYVYFWRWATWKVFDAHRDQPTGIVAFISPSSFTTGTGYTGMRQYLRRAADEGWIIDLSPEEFRPDASTRVFPEVQHKLCIAIFARYGRVNRSRPARVHYLAIAGSQEEKFRQLAAVSLHDDAAWVDCGDKQRDLFVPAAKATWLQLPALGELMPWSHPGCKPNRTWVYAPDPATLQRRWERLIRAGLEEKSHLLKESRDRTISTLPQPLPGTTRSTGPIAGETGTSVGIERVAARSFDRQHLIYDARVLDFARAPLWQVRGDRQVYVTEQHAHPVTGGPGLMFSSLVPDMHHFNSRGGRVLPLYRDASGLAPNTAPGLTRALARRLGLTVSPEDFLAYFAGVIAHPGFTARFAEELKTPGIRVPLTASPQLWAEAVDLGRTILWLHTYGERYTDAAHGRPPGAPRLAPSRRPHVLAGIPDDDDHMPGKLFYEKETGTLHIGDGAVGPVPQQVWDYEVSGMLVVRRWFDYRKETPRVRRSSPLNEITSTHWTPKFTTELLDLLNVLGLCIELEPQQNVLLNRICGAPLITVADLGLDSVLPPPPRATKPPPPDDPNVLTLL